MRRQIIDGCVVESDNEIREGKRIHGLGKVTRTFNHRSDGPMEPNKSMCHGCDNDFYNDHNPYGVKECWSFRKSIVCNKVGHSSIHVPNGPDIKMVHTLTCWHGVSK